jgi:hypothetical protein
MQSAPYLTAFARPVRHCCILHCHRPCQSHSQAGGVAIALSLLSGIKVL